jgi:hypothetical protein
VNPDYGNRCWLSVEHIADEVGLTARSSLQRIFSSLEDKGLLTRVEHYRKDGSRTSNSYRLPDFERGRDVPHPGDGGGEDEEAQEKKDTEATSRRDANERATLPGVAPTRHPRSAGAASPRSAGAARLVAPTRPRGGTHAAQTVRVTGGSNHEVESKEQPNSGASASVSSDQVTGHAVDARPTPIPAVEDDFVPIEVEREREWTDRRAAREERERVEAEQRAEMLREREQRDERQVRVVERYLEEHGVPPTTESQERVDLLHALHREEDPEQRLPPAHRIPWLLVERVLRERERRAAPA